MSTVPLLTPRAGREQQSFRAAMNAMARPGSIDRLPLHPQGGSFAPVVSLLEALLDHEVSFAVLPAQAAVIDTLLRLTGSRVETPSRADYLLCRGEGILAGLRTAGTGTPEYPDRGGTVIATIDGVSDGPDGNGAAPLTLAGPGIDGTRTVWLYGVPAQTWTVRAERNADLPLGVDLILVAADGRFTCLSRYTRIVKE